MECLYIDNGRTLSTNITEESRDNNRPLYQFPPRKLFVSPVETFCFHGGNTGLQPDYLTLRYAIVVDNLRILSMNV